MIPWQSSFFVTMEDVEYGTVLRVSDFPAPPVHEGNGSSQAGIATDA